MIRFLVRAVIALLVCAAATASVVGTAAAQDRALYTGTVTTTIQLVDVYTRPVGTPTFSTNVGAILSPARPGETNPFGLVMQSEPVANAPGEWMIWSAAPVDNDVTFQYWSYGIGDDGTLRGQLVDNQTRAGATTNVVTAPAEIAPNVPMPMQYAMATGTTISGTFTDSRLSFVIEGRTADQLRPFRIEGVLDRVS